jgi:hypothetical protein
MMPPSRRGLQLKDPRKLNAYIQRMCHQMEYHNILDKIEALEEKASPTNWNKNKLTSYEKVDSSISDSMRHSERTITRTRTPMYNWSIGLTQSIQTV